ncbi:hypothetical protein D8674_011684 [Pyrus ussuriensis x Pyrus communis]|uniref:At2g29880-like C-terminal domain-containing protein n=1 Tax=Pyrus ussuriensis x Pyrus communis TaxID=2448454 RepID=A0A5N5FZJ5_9ROSA|nr:hypothetical protein D8674_011684 [Pyrus ussuriensis x Pyrus communis]
MGDSQQEKIKGNYNQWYVKENNMLQLPVETINNGWRDANGIISKQTIEAKIVLALNEKLGCKKLKIIHNSGFSWDPVTKKFTASDESHPKSQGIRKETFADYKDLMTVFGDGTAKGNNSIGLGDDTDATTYRVKESRPVRVDEFPPFDENVEQLDPLFQTPSYASSFLDANFEAPAATPVQKLLPRKRSQPEFEPKLNGTTSHIFLMEKVSVGMDSIAATATEIQGIHSIMAKREKDRVKKEMEKKEEEKNNNVWDAIKETPNLDAPSRYKAFLKMTPEERSEWIKYNME